MENNLIKKTNVKKSKGKLVLFFPHFGADQDVWMPFPYLYLAPFLEQAGYEVCIIDSRVEKEWEVKLRKEETKKAKEVQRNKEKMKATLAK